MLALLVVLAGVEGSELLLATVGVVVIASLVIHGASASPLSAWYERKIETETLDEEREGTVADLFEAKDEAGRRISIDELNDLMASPTPPVVLDVRSRAHFESSDGQIPGSIRVLPDQVTEWAADQARDRMVVAYCT